MKIALSICMVLLAGVAMADELSVGVTASMGGDQIGFRWENAKAEMPGSILMVRDGDQVWSALAGLSMLVGDRAAVYVAGGGQNDDDEWKATYQVGGSYRLGSFRAHVGYDFTVHGKPGPAAGVGWSF